MAVKKTDLWFNSRDEVSKIHAIKWEPEEKPKAVLQIVHGMAEYVDRYDEFARFMVEKGFVVVGDDHLGHGKTASENNAVYGYFCKQDPATVAVRDVHRLKKMTQEQYPGIPYILFGHSMGSFITRNYLVKYGKGIQAAVICGTGDQPKALVTCGKLMCNLVGLFCGQKHISPFLDKMSFSTYNNRIQNKRTNFDWLSVNSENVDRYIADPDCGRIFTVNGFKTLLTLVGRLKDMEYVNQMPKELPVFLIAGSEDPVGDYGEAIKRVYSQYQDIGMKDVSMKLYEGKRHEILNEDNRTDISSDIYEWICSKVDLA